VTATVRGQTMVISDLPNPRPVKFSASVEDAIKEAKSRNRPFFILFCTPDVASTAGEDEKAYEAYHKSHNGEAPHWTVFDCPLCSDIMRKKGLAAFVKVANTEANKEIFKRYGAHENMLMICTPDGNSVLATSGDSHNGMVLLLNEYEDSKNGKK
jgi:hypothetical protein